jgi:hypothetical protein
MFALVVNVSDCYPKGAAVDSRIMHGFLPYLKEVENKNIAKLVKKQKNSKGNSPSKHRIFDQFTQYKK